MNDFRTNRLFAFIRRIPDRRENALAWVDRDFPEVATNPHNRLFGRSLERAPAAGRCSLQELAPSRSRSAAFMVSMATTACPLLLGLLLTGAVEHDPFRGAVEVVRYSFESEQDLDFDGQPDDWTRRKGPGFPSYVTARIDRERGADGSQSLHVDVNGGQMILYAPPVRIDSLHSYVFEGRIRTQHLKHNAAVISVSFLNHRRQRVQRFLTRPVTGTHSDWTRVRLGPLAPDPSVRFVVIGCHVVNGRKMDIRGDVWFDGLWLGKLPQLLLDSNFQTHFRLPSAPVEICARVGGLDPGAEYRLQLELLDGFGKLIASESFELAADEMDAKSEADRFDEDAHHTARAPILWRQPPQECGYYLVRSQLVRDGTVILEKQSALAVMNLVETSRDGEFGWSLGEVLANIPAGEMADIAAQAGINWLKHPVWSSVHNGSTVSAADVNELFERLNQLGIRPVGLLSDPPAELRSKFAKDWTGVSEIFTLPRRFWAPSLEPVIARYSSNVQHWQLGGENDDSFIGLEALPETLGQVKQEFDRIGRNTQVGVHWNWETPLPFRSQLPQSFLSIDGSRAEDRAPPHQLAQRLRSSSSLSAPRWVLLHSLPKSDYTLDERGADLVKRMLAAKMGRAEAIFATRIVGDEHGLLNENGAPTPLFLPWRTAALALQASEFVGSLSLEGGSENYLFDRGDEVVLFIWNDDSAAPLTEKVYLGERVTAVDIWGREHALRLDPESHQQHLTVGRVPLIVRNCSAEVARWRMAVQFARGRLQSATGRHSDAIIGRNTFEQGVNVRVALKLPPEWEAEPDHWELSLAPNEKYRLDTNLTIPANVSLGKAELFLDFEIDAEQQYRFRVPRAYEVGLGDVTIAVTDRRLEDGRLEVEQTIINQTNPIEVLNFQCSLFIPGQRRQRTFVTKLGEGKNQKKYYLPNADALRGGELWLRAEQIDGRRVLNYRWTVGETWDDLPVAAP